MLCYLFFRLSLSSVMQQFRYAKSGNGVNRPKSEMPIIRLTVKNCLLLLLLLCYGCSEVVDAQCRSNPCLNGGTCKPSSKGDTCYCQDGYTGILCESRCHPTPQDDPNVPWNMWTTFGECSVTCGGDGIRSRHRSCGRRDSCSNNCMGPSSESQACAAEQPCCDPHKVQWGPWGPYNSCMPTCNVGIQWRFRNCSVPLDGSSVCSYLCQGPMAQSRPCGVNACCNSIMHGWSEWVTAGCSKTCGGGVAIYRRTCQSQGSHCAHICIGDETERTEICNTQICCEGRIHGWTDWTTQGMQVTRQCRGQGTNCVSLCEGPSSMRCSTNSCCEGANLGWSEWSPYSSCSRTCGGGRRQRSRTCRQAIESCVYDCRGSDIETEDCNTLPCCEEALHGWTAWSNYTDCSKTCNVGRRNRRRMCKSHIMSHCSYLCAGMNEEVDTCNVRDCCDNTTTKGWLPWAGYTQCTQGCNGTKQRKRACLSAGTDSDCSAQLCQGPDVDVQPCDMFDCCGPVDGVLVWSNYSSCSKTCGGGIKTRYRECNAVGHCQYQCPAKEPRSQSVSCNTQPCVCDEQTHGWNAWSSYSSCSITCDTGLQHRTRTCKSVGTSCAFLCYGFLLQSKSCTIRPCCTAEEHGWTAWSEYGTCSKNCGEGTQQRSRVCLAANSNCRKVCIGSYTESRSCTESAARDGGWSAWTDRGCSATCGSGIHNKFRTCSNPAPNVCGRSCVGTNIESHICSGLPPCCQTEGNIGARIYVSSQEVSIDNDPGATAVGVAISCHAVICHGDKVQSLVLGKAESTRTVHVVPYAEADIQVNGGQVVDKVTLPNTQLAGSVAQDSLLYIRNNVKCEDAGLYQCDAKVRTSNDRGKLGHLSAASKLKVTVIPGRFRVKPVGSPGYLQVGEVLLLNCSGSVGTMTPTTQSDVVWESKDKGATSWTKVSNPYITAKSAALPNSCQHMDMWRVMRLMLTTQDNGRTYRCFLLKDGKAHGDGDSPDEDTFAVKFNSPLNPVALAELSIEPQAVTVTSSNSQRVTVLCQGLQSQNSLVALILSHRALEDESGTELASTDQPNTVSTKVPGKQVTVTGGLSRRVINYTLPQVTCLDAGTYICTTVTKLANTTNTDRQESSLDVDVYYYRTNMKKNWTKEGGIRIICSTLVRDVRKAEELKWHWQTTDTDPRSTAAVWTEQTSSRFVTISDPTTSTPSHRCFVISTSVLTDKDPTTMYQRPDSKFYRCFIAIGDHLYYEFKSGDYPFSPASSVEQRNDDSNSGQAVGTIVGSLLLVCLLGGVCVALLVKSRQRQMELRHDSFVLNQPVTTKSEPI